VRYAVFAARPTPWTANEMTAAMYLPTHTRFDTLVAGVLLASVQHYHGAGLAAALRRRPALRVALGAVPALCCWLLLGPLPWPADATGATDALSVRWIAGLAGRHDLSTVFAWGTVTSVGYFALILLLLNTEGALTRFLSSQWFRRFATLGYGVYLVHPTLIAKVVLPVEAVMLLRWRWPLGEVWLSGLALLLVVATAVAYGLHLLVEKPALWLRDKLAR
jgi:peptidoglycan/LPS O-acetylase OafA/YrhL